MTNDANCMPLTVSSLPAVWAPTPWGELRRGDGVWADDVDEDAYFALPLASRSRLEVLRESPALYYARFVAPETERILDEDTKALRVGRYTHCAVLESARWDREFVCEPDWQFHANSKDGKAERAEWKAKAARANQCIMKADEYQLAMAMYGTIALAATPTARIARDMLMCADAKERVAIWRDKVTGLLCRARIDAIHYGKLIADLKTADDVSPEAFGFHAARRGYARQAAMYTDAVEAITGERLPFADVAIEKSGTHRVAIYELDDYALEAGRRQYRSLLVELDRRLMNNDWIDDCEREPQKLSLPGFALIER